MVNRLVALRGTGFRHVFLVNHHGGRGQFATLEALAQERSAEDFAVHAVRTYKLSDVQDESMRVGGHAGLSETTWVLAFGPELVDLSHQEDGELSVRHTGILHNRPTVEEKWNPRRASAAVAAALRESVVKNFVRLVREQAGLD